MSTYLQTQDVLNVAVSCFANYDSPANPVTINLLTWLRSQKHRAKVGALREVEDKAARDALKATLPAITPSAVFIYRQESDMVAGSHTRLIQFDIDLKDNKLIRNYADLKAQICNLPFVAYCGLSASGKGYWGLVPIADPERHGQHFDALKRVFAHYGILIDTKPRNVASLRGYSYDAGPYMPESVMLFELYDVPPPPKPRPFDLTSDADTERERVEVCIQEVLRRSTHVGDNYGTWYEVGCSLGNAFGESGREYYHLVSQNYPGYQSSQTDKQFTACLRANSKATLGTFFHLCQQISIEWKELMPAPAARPDVARPVSATKPAPSRPAIVKTSAEQLSNPGAILKPNESQVDRNSFPPLVPGRPYPAECDAANEAGVISGIRIHNDLDSWSRHKPMFDQFGVPISTTGGQAPPVPSPTC